MRGYIVKRLLIALVTLVGMSMVIFVLLRLAPGNIVDVLFESAGYVDQADKKQLERELGVDRPIAVQYARWVGELAHGDLGKSYRYDMPAWNIIKPRLPVTLELAVLALLFSILFGVPSGVVSAARQNRPIDYALRVLSLAGLSMPSFWLGMVIILLFVRAAG
jgi:peptide/nickel transport system permease protein